MPAKSSPSKRVKTFALRLWITRKKGSVEGHSRQSRWRFSGLGAFGEFQIGVDIISTPIRPNDYIVTCWARHVTLRSVWPRETRGSLLDEEQDLGSQENPIAHRSSSLGY